MSKIEIAFINADFLIFKINAPLPAVQSAEEIHLKNLRVKLNVSNQLIKLNTELM